MFLWLRLCEHRRGECENNCEPNLHEPKSFRLTSTRASAVPERAPLRSIGDRRLLDCKEKVVAQDAATSTLEACAAGYAFGFSHWNQRVTR
jgi:hypothetical protein